MAMVGLEDIRAAQRRLQGIAVHTPIVLCPRSGIRRDEVLLYIQLLRRVLLGDPRLPLCTLMR